MFINIIYYYLFIYFNQQGQVDIYTDLRDAKAKLGIDFELMEEREKKRSKMPKTNIVCKFFLEAVKHKVYGWKWHCPNGDDCHYKHCLPKDYIIKTLQGQVQEEMTFEEFHDLEEKIDEERERVAINGTKVTEKTLEEWLEKRKKEREKNGGVKKMDLMKKLKTGKELFMNNKDTYKDDENADDDVYENQGNVLDEDNKNIQDEEWFKSNYNKDENKYEGNTNNNNNNNKEDVKVDEDLFKDEGNLDDLDLDDEGQGEGEGEGNDDENNQDEEEK